MYEPPKSKILEDQVKLGFGYSILRLIIAVLVCVPLAEFGQRVPNEISKLVMGPVRHPGGEFNTDFAIAQLILLMPLYILVGFLASRIAVKYIAISVVLVLLAVSVREVYLFISQTWPPKWYLILHPLPAFGGIIVGAVFYKRKTKYV